MTPIPLTETQMAELFRLRSENAALKEQVAQLKLIEEQALKVCLELDSVTMAIPDCRYMDPPDGGNVSLGEQVSRMWQDVQKWQLAASKNADCIRDQHETITQQAAVIEQMREALVGERDLRILGQSPECGQIHWESLREMRRGVYGNTDAAIATQPSPEILQARDERVAEACAKYLCKMHMYDTAEAMLGEWRKYL
jgi:hypothetical protein